MIVSNVVSATTRFNQDVGARTKFLRRAVLLLSEARSQQERGVLDAAVEEGYRAALRTAGALVANSSVSRRRRLPSSAWDQLSLVDAECACWAARLSRYSGLRNRAMCVTGFLDGAVVDKFLNEVGEFIDVAERREGILRSAA
ncbi:MULTISPECIES: SAV_6107 family HEPN domain-containing protein [unclassified Corynebacterium]|uniref:SAV_6107 family HEPN domain-containing protein n=1 Tax=unclassified Corynebacterium TaxID=2624378 RepID=UPI0035240F0D